MAVCVKSEIGVLKKVLLKRPGIELEHLSPATMEELLFDDIPYLYGAQKEHDEFARILRDNGTEVVYLDDLIVESLAQNELFKKNFIEDIICHAGATALGYHNELAQYLNSIQDLHALILKTMAGITFAEIEQPSHSLSSLVRPPSRFIVKPMPNLYFTRDPFACIGKGVSLNHMHTLTRNRENIFGKYILSCHPDFGQVPLYYTPDYYFTIEGGDILNLNDHVLAAGISERTQPEAIEQLAKNIFADKDGTIDVILAFDIPQTRAFMHLDTVLTQVDKDKFTVHPGIIKTLRIFELTPGRNGELHVKQLKNNLSETLSSYIGINRVTLIPCGGSSKVASEREQWNDGSNTLCIAPGKVVVYDRNYITNKLLRDSGVTVIELASSELSRGRGGPRCMSMPLIREAL